MQSSEQESSDVTQETSDEWIVQSKSRKLVPQQGLTGATAEADKAKAVAAGDLKKKVTTIPKKEDGPPRPVTRYTKEEMLTFRQHGKHILRNMLEMTEVVSLDKLNPVCFERLDPEDVIRIWNADKSNQNKQNAADGAGRGRGRGKFEKGDGQEGDHVPGDWSTAKGDTQSGKRDLWDDGKGASSSNGAGGAFDLSDFAAMSQKFRDEMHEMKMKGGPEGVEITAPGEDTMERLLREQKGLGGLEDEEDEMPDWASDSPVKATPATTGARSLLLDTLNVKREQAPVASSGGYSALGGLDVSSILGGSLLSGLTAPAPAVVVPPPAPVAVLLDYPQEWFYTDPQGTVQGPFEQENMRQWNEAGYFGSDLPIKLRSWARFHVFGTIFQDQKSAFVGLPMEPGTNPLLHQQQLNLIAQREREEREREVREAQAAREAILRKQQQEAAERAAAERAAIEAEQRRQRERELEAQRLLQQQQAHQQQILKEQAEQQRLARERASAEQAAAAAASPTKAAPVAPWANKTAPSKGGASSLANIQNEQKARADVEQDQKNSERKRQQAEQAKIAKGWQASSGAAAAPSLAEIQEEEEARLRQANAQAASSAAPAPASMSNQLKNLLGVGRINAAAVQAAHPQPSTTAPWSASSGSAPTAAASSGRSLKDIMQEEQQQAEASSPAPVAASSSGAVVVDAPAPVIRKGPSSWATKAGSNVPANYVAPASVAPAPVQQAAPAPKKPVVNLSSIAPAKPAAAATSAAPAASSAEFGGNKEMRKELADWCAAQLKRINGNEDITLMQFVYTVDDAAEIREYLSSYLGSSAQVTNFATDFIKYKAGGKVPAVESSAGAFGGAAQTNANNGGNGNGGFVSANKKKGKPTGTRQMGFVWKKRLHFH